MSEISCNAQPEFERGIDKGKRVSKSNYCSVLAGNGRDIRPLALTGTRPPCWITVVNGSFAVQSAMDTLCCDHILRRNEA